MNKSPCIGGGSIDSRPTHGSSMGWRQISWDPARRTSQVPKKQRLCPILARLMGLTLFQCRISSNISLATITTSGAGELLSCPCGVNACYMKCGTMAICSISRDLCVINTIIDFEWPEPVCTWASTYPIQQEIETLWCTVRCHQMLTWRSSFRCLLIALAYPLVLRVAGMLVLRYVSHLRRWLAPFFT